MSSRELLSIKMQERISEFGWYELTDIQEKTIPMIINTTKDLIVESDTASGKTEAAFLPILSVIEETNYTEEVKVLYISPLKALINDQFSRIYKLTEEMNIRTTKWHGDVSGHLKKNFLSKTNGILQITPESIEAFMVNRQNELKNVFGGIEFIIIDEIHSFIGNDRGYHLQSLLHRIKGICNNIPRIIGISATIDGIDTVKEWINNSNPNNVELIKSTDNSKTTYCNIMHMEKNEELDEFIPEAIINDILTLTENKKVLIFCNSRDKVEYLTVKLNEKLGTQQFYAHHSYLDKKLREDIEELIKTEEDISIVSTSTLELGIDIGSVDMVIQLDCTFSVSSLKQRVGRTGRRRNQNRIAQIYTTDLDSLLLAVATTELMKEKIVEKPIVTIHNYDYLFQQILSIVTEKNRIGLEDLINQIIANPVFNKMQNADIVILIRHMIAESFISVLDGSSEVVLGYQGEKIVINKDFYAIFSATEPFEVFYESKKIGIYDELLNPGQLLMLSGRTWIIDAVDGTTKKMYVSPFAEYIKPNFSGMSFNTKSNLVRQKILEILKTSYQPSYVNILGLNQIEDYSLRYRGTTLKESDILCYKEKDSLVVNLFESDNVIRTLKAIFHHLKIDECSDDPCLGNLLPNKDFDIKKFNFDLIIDNSFYNFIEPMVIGAGLSKYYSLLPYELKLKIYIERVLDIDNTIDILKNRKFIMLNSD